MVSELTWHCPPPHFEISGSSIQARTGDGADFWRGTFYNFIHDNGHFLHATAHGDFSAEVTIRGGYEALYDQAGLMIRVDERNWIKAGVEYTDGSQHFSSVVTREHSDWSMTPLTGNPPSLDIRMTRHAEAIRVQYRTPDSSWRLARLAYLPMTRAVLVGPMCCSPKRAGFEVEFRDFRIKPPIARDLHD